MKKSDRMMLLALVCIAPHMSPWQAVGAACLFIVYAVIESFSE